MLNFNIDIFTAIVIILCIFSGIALYLSLKSKDVGLFSKAVTWVTFCILINSVYVLSIETIPWFRIWKSQLTPFSLLYGPLLYFAIKAAERKPIKRQQVVLHALPFLAYTVFLILLFIGIIDPTSENQRQFTRHLTVVNPISFGGYAIWSMLQSKDIFNRLKEKAILIIIARMIMLFVTMLGIGIFFSSEILSDTSGVLVIRFTLFVCMLISILIIINYRFNELLNPERIKEADMLRFSPIEANNSPKYERSSLSDAQLNTYKQKLEHGMNVHSYYLNKDLSLTLLASKLKIPNHHLTQVFNVAINKTFYQYVNKLRVERACILLKESANTPLEDIAKQSGFNSKVSFNRHFKLLVKCTPQAYKNRLKTIE